MNAKLNWMGIIVATVVAFFIGFLWYGLIFEATWLALTNTTKSEDMSMLPMAYGFVQTFVTMVGLGWFIARDGDAGWMAGLKIGLVAGVCFALMTSAYGFLYGTAPIGLLPIDWSHLLVIYAVGGAIIGGLKMKPKT
ncbi:DUF1761 domain-containing protein [Brevundimonas sp.]|uniref:DUF1761 domain-containing protein n=1 Tax=Brevundimonas sp. TaxID=1871086 RepID=UPI002D4D96C4|nr:DUF1761 domain-containing protein [Brevundimonas sp.]HYC96958.1 DUF1761 domain-containing protein [Brevundimonas sp.]